MKFELEYKSGMSWLCLPYEYDAPVTRVRIADRTGKERQVPIRLAIKKIDLWMSYPLKDFSKGILFIEAGGENWLRATYISQEPAKQKRRELSRPQIHYMPISGGISSLDSISKEQGMWRIRYTGTVCSLDNISGGGVPVSVMSKDLLHWEEVYEEQACLFEPERANWWNGDVEEEVMVKDDKKIYSIAKSTGHKMDSCAGACILSIPAEIRGGEVQPTQELKNLRVWERTWCSEKLEKDFSFVMRFRISPGTWPEIRILEGENTAEDIQTKACEVEAELFVGQESEIEFELCGIKWKWDALEQNMTCGKYRVKTPVDNGRLYLHFFSDMTVQEFFNGTDRAMLITKPDGPEKKQYRIGSKLVENINNDSFCFAYNADPYIKISTPGTSASIIRMNVWGLRATRYSEKNMEMLKGIEKGQKIYECNHYTIYTNCVEDRIYGEPYAWALDGGKTVLSPVRVKEEFEWRATPWGDMTRVIDRSERWDSPKDNVYPRLKSSCPVLNAAFGIATDVLLKNRNENYSLPGQEGLMNAALFQGKGEGFGSWVRDTCHSAFRCQNLLAPEEIRESLIYISEHGFNNGVDCAAMPAIAAWDHYIASGDRQILFEMFPGILRYAEEADSRYDERLDLVHADMCIAQDAFPETENGGYCLSTEIAFYLMYKAISKICAEIDCEKERGEKWRHRSENMLRSIKEKYWNDEKGCFTSGPIGSEAYRHGWWELTGAELALWPRFEIAEDYQRDRFLKSIIHNSEACSDFGINWYPFRKEKNHFWRACWVSWTQGIASAVSLAGNIEFLERLIFQQVRNVMLNRSFYEVIDHDTGKAWRWPHLPWHAAAFIGYIVNGVFGLTYDESGLKVKPLIPKAFKDATLENVRYRNACFNIQIHDFGICCKIELDGKEKEGRMGTDLTGKHRIDIYGLGGIDTAQEGGMDV